MSIECRKSTRKKKILESYEELIETDSGNDKSEEIDDKNMGKRQKLLNKVRCQRYREKKKVLKARADSHLSNSETLTAEEKEKIERRKEKYKEASQRYRNRKRLNMMNLHVDHYSGMIVKHASDTQNYHSSQIAGPSTKNVPYIPPNHTWSEHNIPESHSNSDDDIHNDLPLEVQINCDPQLNDQKATNYEPNPQNIHLNHVQNYAQSMDFQNYLPVQTYSSFFQDARAHLEFKRKFFGNNFGHACDICDKLFFKTELKKLVNHNATPRIEFIRKILPNSNIAEVKICPACWRTIRVNRVPAVSVYNGFKYPPFPENLQKYPLDLVTERLITPRSPFTQIRRLRHVLGQFGIYGQVINIPLEVNTMISALPRSVDDDDDINVHIKKKLIFKSNSVHGIVNKSKLKAWLQYLKDTPLYTFFGITVDDSFLNGEDDVQNEIKFDEDGDNDISEKMSADESLIAQQQTLMWDAETYLKIAAEDDNDPIGLLFDEYAEELSFPQIYLGQFRTFREGVYVTPLMMARNELRRSDRRGVIPQHLLYLAIKIIRIRIRDSLFQAFKHIGKDGNITKQQIQSQFCINNYIENNLSFLRTIPNSTYYWSEMKKDLFAMIRQYGKPTVFLTITANEMEWPELLQLLHNLKYNSEKVEDVTALHFTEKSTLINEDTVTCAIYFNRMVNVVMDILKSKNFSPFKKYRILNYFQRIEFQHEGSPQAHILAWLDNAPEDALGRDYNKAIEFIDFLISVSAAEASGRVKLQKHHHTSTCYKGASKGFHECRFETPFMPVKKTMILTPIKETEIKFKVYKEKYNAIKEKLANCEYDNFDAFYEDNNIESDEEYINILRAGINRPRVYPKRQPYEKWHNPFNPFIFNIVKSSTNFKFITDEDSCAAYVAEYFNKSNTRVSDLQTKIMEIVDEHQHITKNISINLRNHTEMTTQEAAWFLVQEPVSKCSTSIVHIPIARPIERLKTKKTAKDSSEVDDDCPEVRKENWFNKYEKRPEDLENVSLAQFVAYYYKNIKGEYVKRDEPRIIRYQIYDMAKDFNEYRRQMVTLHIPFRNEEAEILKERKFIQVYDKNVDLISQKRKEFESNIDIGKLMRTADTSEKLKP